MTTTQTSMYDQASYSYGRCCQKNGFFDSFYSILKSSHPGIEKMFANTDFTKQNELLRVGLELMLLFDHGNDAAKQSIDKIRVSHSRHRLNIKPEFYDYWINSLMKACAQHDAEFTTEVEIAWRQVLANSIEHIKSGYHEGIGEADCLSYLQWLDPNLEMLARAWRGLSDSLRAELIAKVKTES